MHLRTRRGVTLTEIMMAFLIMVMALLPISNLISFGHRGTQKDLRIVLAQELLVDRMNQLNAIPFKQLNPLIITGTHVRLTSRIFSGTNLEVPLGDIARHGATYTISATLTRVPASFTYRPVDFGDLDYDQASATSWRFKAEKEERFDAGTNPYKILRTQVYVNWTEPHPQKPRQIEAVSYVVDYED
jgi:hypothetical protein